MKQDPKKPAPKRPVPAPRPKPRPPIQSGPDQILRERRRMIIAPTPDQDTRDVFEKVFRI